MNKAQLLSVYKMNGNEKFVWNAFCDMEFTYSE